MTSGRDARDFGAARRRRRGKKGNVDSVETQRLHRAQRQLCEGSDFLGLVAFCCDVKLDEAPRS